ncbi:3-methyl-2-oxobutanoate hydroxymethyltransferase [Hwanghaeella sp.]|uniref:3-methyl-2-oxobutanoate hydroxymethyltransferase n=1 Tax=Hwanghaeella sp. TaxID=2605943 RepID=UPI003CCBCE28
MPTIFTFGGKMAKRNVTVADLQAGKGKRQFTETTVFKVEDAITGAAAGIDVLRPEDTFVAETVAAAPETFISALIPFDAYETPDQILGAAIRAVSAGADAVYTPRGLKVVEMLAREGIPVQGHLGLVPRKSTWVGGLRAIGKTCDEALQLYQTFKDLENAGAYAAEVELVPPETLALINERTSLVTYSIGCGGVGDVIFLFMDDICGELESPPRHAKAYADLRSLRAQLRAEQIKALTAFKEDVDAGTFPGPGKAARMANEELDAFREALDRM